jgi:hypothetical protein
MPFQLWHNGFEQIPCAGGAGNFGDGHRQFFCDDREEFHFTGNRLSAGMTPERCFNLTGIRLIILLGTGVSGPIRRKFRDYRSEHGWHNQELTVQVCVGLLVAHQAAL